jgi:hypothetical protein
LRSSAGGTNASCPHVSQPDHRLAFIAAASHFLQRHASDPQGIREFTRLLTINAIHEHARRGIQLAFALDCPFEHFQHGKEVGDRLLIHPKKHVHPDNIAFKDQTEIAKAALRARLVSFASAGPCGIFNVHQRLPQGVLILCAHDDYHHKNA